MTSIKTKVERRERRDDGRLVFVYDYQGPGGPAQAETRGDGTTHIDGQGIPATTVELDLHAKGRAFKAGVPGRVGDSTLQVVRPSFGLTPASRAMTFTLGDGASWFLVSSGWGKAELRRADVDGPPVFRRGSVALEVDDSITADEVALLLVCEVSAPYVYVKILARVLAITSYV
jgi:hypothetical protein